MQESNGKYLQSHVKGPQTFDVEVGDTKQPDFHPQVKMSRWDNECNFSMRLQGFGNASPQNSPIFDGAKAEWAGNNATARFYQHLDDSGFEFEVDFTAKPPTRNIVFSLRHKGLRFSYQDIWLDESGDEITEKVIDGEIHSRPAKVNGSYAVYHSNKKGQKRVLVKTFNEWLAEKGHPPIDGNGAELPSEWDIILAIDEHIGWYDEWLDDPTIFKYETQYGTGKAFPLYRAWIEDADGWRVWCDWKLNLPENKLTAVIPQDFYDNANWSFAKLDPNMGYVDGGGTGIIGSSDSGSTRAWGYRVQAPENGDITSISAYHEGVTDETGEAAIYDDKAGPAPDNKLSESNQISLTDLAWNTYTISQAITSGTWYWLADQGSASINFYYDTNAASDRGSWVQTYSVWEDPHGGFDATATQDLSIYATYTASGGGATGKSNPLSGPLGGPLAGVL